LKLKAGDLVQVIAGDDKGKKGAILDLDRTGLKLKVQGVRMQTHFDRENGIEKKEGFIDYSNVKFVEAAKPKKTSKAKKKA